MTRAEVSRVRRTNRYDARGFTLLEVIIAVVILATVTGAVAAVLVTSLNAASATTQKVRESNDAQFIAGFLVSDAQAAGGTNPLTASVDTTLGVSLTDPAGCTAPGSLTMRFKWVDRASAAGTITRVASYYYNSSTNQFSRQTCSTPPQPSDTNIVLGRQLSPAPVPRCDGATTCSSNMPNTVSLTVTETNSPKNAPTPYTYTLSASLRPQSQRQPVGGSTASVTTLVSLGAGPCNGLSVSGSITVTVNGGAVVNAADGSGCTGMVATGAATYNANGPTYTVGTCGGSKCPTITQIQAPVVDPLAGLPTPPNAGNCGAGGSNPPLVGGHYQGNAAGLVFPQALGITGTVVFDPGIYIFCNGVAMNAGANVTANHVLFYVAGGALQINGQATVSLSSYTSAPYVNLLIWQAAADASGMGISGGATVNNYAGIIYAPSAMVTVGGGAGSIAGSIIAKQIVFAGGGNVTVGTRPLAISGPAALPAGTINVAYPSTTVTATDGVIPYTWSATNLPAGLSIGAGTGTISGTPTVTGTFSVVVTVTDSAVPTAATATRTYTLTINAPALSVSGPATLRAWTINRPYPVTTFTAAGGTPPYGNWSATGLPAGMMINASGALSGTPTASGTFSVTVTVRDSANVPASRTYSLTINTAPSITTNALPNGGTNQPYPGVTMAATNGTTPYASWTLSPAIPGLIMNANTGVLSGTATAAGTYNVTVTMTDAAGATATHAYTVIIATAPAPTNVTLGNGNGTLASGDTVTITYSDVMSVASLCSTWSGDNTNQSLTGNGDVVVTVADNGNNDVLTVAVGSCTFNLGSIALGGNYVAANRTFSGNGGNKSTITWTAATHTLVITLGSASGSTNSGVAAAKPVYTPAAAITNNIGIAINTAPFTAPANSRF